MKQVVAPRATIRLDKWLWQARFFKTRALAAEVAEDGHLRINAMPTRKPGAAVVRIGLPRDEAVGLHPVQRVADRRLRDPELARQALITAAEMFEKSGRSDESLRVYRKYITVYPKPVDVNMETQFRLHTAYAKQGNTIESDNMLRELSRSYDRAGAENTARTQYLGAMAKFRLSRPVYDEFAAIALSQPLKQSLARKRQAMQKALDTYSKVSAMGVAEFTTASNYQIAEIYRKLAADLMASERPKGLNALELEQYGILLEEQATPFEDKALDLYVANANLARQNIYDDFVRQSFDALARLSPGRYNKREQSEPYVDVIY